MAVRGIFQLRKLSTSFCDLSGSSKGVRQFLECESLQKFIQENKQIDFEFILKRGHHPVVKGEYINNMMKDRSLRNMTSNEIMQQLIELRQQAGIRKYPHEGRKVYGIVKSVQGEWRPNLWNNHPIARLECFHKEIKIKTPQVIGEKDLTQDKYKVDQTMLHKKVFQNLDKKAPNYDHEPYY